MKTEHFRNTDNQKKRIVSVIVKREVDDCPDLSWIGEYSNQPGANAIDHQERGDCDRGEYRYFNATLSGEETGNPESVEQDYQRMEKYNRGDRCMIGVYAVAQVVLAGGLIQTIRSGGLWGIESDSGDDYFKSIEQEEFDALGKQLEALGFTSEEVCAAFDEHCPGWAD